LKLLLIFLIASFCKIFFNKFTKIHFLKITTKHITYDTNQHTCKNCNHNFHGKICNQCGEKVFDEKQLTAKYFFHQVLDFFWHWESKVLKSIKLNFLKPGFITKENINGIRVPYAKPIQLYLVVAFLFYIIVSKVGATDYIPSHEDHYYFSLSNYKLFTWAKPIDTWAINGIDSLWERKGRELQMPIEDLFKEEYSKSDSLIINNVGNTDSVVLSINKIPILAYNKMRMVRQRLYNNSIGAFSKTFIFVLLPFFAAFFFLFFFKKIKYFGASLMLATHFMIYNLCFYSLIVLINLATSFTGYHKNLLMLPFNRLLFNDTTTPFSELIFGSPFEFLHLVFWMPWLFIAFKRMFNTTWWKNLIISYLCSRVFFYLIFGVLKKLLIAFTIWTMHG
jgi:hypothetical protein